MDIKIAPKVINVHLSAVRLFFCALVSTLPLTTTPDCAGAPSVAFKAVEAAAATSASGEAAFSAVTASCPMLSGVFFFFIAFSFLL